MWKWKESPPYEILSPEELKFIYGEKMSLDSLPDLTDVELLKKIVEDQREVIQTLREALLAMARAIPQSSGFGGLSWPSYPYTPPILPQQPLVGQPQITYTVGDQPIGGDFQYQRGNFAGDIVNSGLCIE